MTDAQRWRTALREALLRARKFGDHTRVSALRSALAAIDNAETPADASVDTPASATIAGGVAGLGAAEVARRELTDAQIRALLVAEIDERLDAAEAFSAGGHTDRADVLRAEAAVIAAVMGDV